MIPILLPTGSLVECSRPGSPVHLQHCPVCGDSRQVKVWRIGRTQGRPFAVVIDCPHCRPTAGLWAT